jgi:hypothetical protein
MEAVSCEYGFRRKQKANRYMARIDNIGIDGENIANQRTYSGWQRSHENFSRGLGDLLRGYGVQPR